LRRFRTIEFPLLKKALIAAAAFSFAISMGEINASLMLSEGTFLTMPIAIYRLIGSYNFAGACALGTLLIASGLAAFFLIDSLGGHDGT
ncbi:MAG: iron ABC transporter permease, partial [Spirochaetales bacterium]|nr:iron ABC transporter permease [Spirochaetales bacterium]